MPRKPKRKSKATPPPLDRRGENGDARNANKAATRLLTVLGRFIGRRASCGVTELSAELGMTKNMVFRALSTLSKECLLVRDSSGLRYELGYGILGLQNALFEDFDLREVCRPTLQRLQEITGESVFLSIIVGRNSTVVDSIAATDVRVNHPPGLLVPLHASTGSRALFAFLSDEEIADYLSRGAPLQKFTETTITDPGKLRAEIAQVRERGYALGLGDHMRDAGAIAFPVVDSTGRPHASITVAGPSERWTQRRIEACLPQIRARIEELNEQTRLFPAPSSALILSPAAR